MTFADFYYAVRGILGHRSFVVRVEAETNISTGSSFITWSVHVHGKVIGGYFYTPEAALAELRKTFPAPENIGCVGDPKEIER